MSDVTITYKGANIATMDATGSKTLQTAGTYCEGDIGVEYVKPGGGGPVSVPAKEVNFRDYDGTVVYAYTPAEFAALSAMPANPDHSGDEIPLTAQGWNWSFADAQAYVATYGRLEVGQMYETTDGKTHVLIHLEQGRTSPMLGCCPNGTVDVDWGDGTAHDTLTGTSVSTVKWTNRHNYATPGDYDIKLTCTGSVRLAGSSSSDQFGCLLRYSSGSDTRNTVYRNAITNVYIGDNLVGIGGSSAFYLCYNLRSITIPHSVTFIGTATFYGCDKLMFVVVPDGITYIGVAVFSTAYGMAVSIPAGITSFESNCFNNCYGLRTIDIPSNTTALYSAFQNCQSLTQINIPESVTTIDNYTFRYCYGMSEYHFFSTTPPTLSGTNTFYGIPDDCVIYVPYSADHSILEAYKTATNWSAYASYMQEEPQ